MSHLVLLGDSILDNAAYTAGGPAVIDQVTGLLPAGWLASLRAVDGATTRDVTSQLHSLPPDTSHLVLSVGGNDALGRADILDAQVACVGDALLLLDDVVRGFEVDYRGAVAACLHQALPLVLCTIYDGNFPDARYQRMVTMALTHFNDVIIRVAMEHGLRIIDLRTVCNAPEDYANPIEPSSIGGARIAEAILRAITDQPDRSKVRTDNMTDDQKYQLTHLTRIFRDAAMSPVFRSNPKYPGDGPFRIAFSDVMDNKYVIRIDDQFRGGSLFWDKGTAVVVSYETVEALVEDGWRLD